MKKLAYLFVFIFATAFLASCGASSQSCVTTQTIMVKNSMFETYEMVVPTEMVATTEKTKPTDYIVTNDNME
ncbi:MAG: hypothetical protein L3J34_02530 [Flavobacteriaceae bacterium]|nr:hypothetical protein [Flavobacteriaceae bacterium]